MNSKVRLRGSAATNGFLGVFSFLAPAAQEKLQRSQHHQSKHMASRRTNKSHVKLALLSVSSNGLNGTIWVYPLEGSLAGMMPVPASANSPTAYTILDVDQNAYLFVGGIIGTIKVSVCLCATSRVRVSLSLFFSSSS